MLNSLSTVLITSKIYFLPPTFAQDNAYADKVAKKQPSKGFRSHAHDNAYADKLAKKAASIPTSIPHGSFPPSHRPLPLTPPLKLPPINLFPHKASSS